MVERRNFGRGTCPEPECGKEMNLTSDGKIRQHGPRKDPCPGSGSEPKESGGTSPAPEPEQETETPAAPDADGDPRPTASEYRAAQQVVAYDLTGPAHDAAVDVLNRAVTYGTREDPRPGTEPVPDVVLSEWTTYRELETKYALAALGEIP
jgi:hypothetical protein